MQRRTLLSLIAIGACAVLHPAGTAPAAPPADSTVTLAISGMT